MYPTPATTQRGLAPFGFPHIREETCPELLRILPMLHLKNPVSTSTNRNISPFNRAAAEASLTTKPQIRWQKPNSVQRCLKSDKGRLGKGFQNLGFGGFSVHFWASKSEPRGVGVGSPHKVPGPGKCPGWVRGGPGCCESQNFAFAAAGGNAPHENGKEAR